MPDAACIPGLPLARRSAGTYRHLPWAGHHSLSLGRPYLRLMSLVSDRIPTAAILRLLMDLTPSLLIQSRVETK